MKNKKIVVIFFTILIILLCIGMFRWQYKKKLEREKQTDISQSIHAIVIKDTVPMYKKPKESKFGKIFALDKGTNAYILEEITDKNQIKWYKVKCRDRLGYILQEHLQYFQASDAETVLMSDVSKFNIQFHHFTSTEEYEVFLLENQIQYVYIRAGGRGYGEEGNFYVDPQAPIFINACEYLRIPYGFYYLDEAINSEEIDQEVQFINRFIKDKKTSMCKLPLAIDIEAHDGEGRADGIWENRMFLAEELVQKLNVSGIQTIIYSNAKTANAYLWTVNANFWIAYYPEEKEIPKYWYTDTMQEPTENIEFMDKVVGWQFTEEGIANQINLKVDVSLVNNTFFRQFVK